MKKIVAVLFIFLLFVSILGGWQSVQASSSSSYSVASAITKIDPAVQALLDNLQPGEMTTVIVTLTQQTDLSRVNGADHAARQQGVIRALQATAEASQRPIKALLRTRRAQGTAGQESSFWVFNGLSVTATQEVILELAARSDVQAITPDSIAIVPSTPLNASAAETNISVINAPALWGLGHFGQGVVVANMDSGVDVSHPDLSQNWRGGTNSWFDPYGQHPSTPTDLSGHGTSTMGLMVGGDAGGTSIGVAPQSEWIAVKIFNDQGGSTTTAIHQGFQWLLDPDSNPATADAPQVVNNSWTYANPGCNLEFQLDLQSLRAADILPVFAAGNYGPNGSTSVSPSNYPEAFAVGATDNNDQMYVYSSRGPTTCGGSTGPFPEIVAPGVSIRTSGLYGTYYTDSGTSFAAPQAAGGLALLLSAYPNLSAADQERALINSAVDLGTSGPDDVYGYGRLDLLAAFNWLATAPTATPPPATATPLPSSTPTSIPNVNLALNRPVTVSSYQDSAHNGTMAVDGDPATYWQTERITGRNKLNTEWITVDLGAIQTVSQVNLAWDAYYATGYTIQVSSNNTSWSTVYSTSSGNGGVETVVFNSVQARYVRLNSTAWNNSTNHNWLREFEVYAGTATAPSPTPTSISTSTPMPTSTPVPTSTPGSVGSIHVGDLDASSSLSRSKWNATVTIYVHDASENLVSNATVTGQWSNGASGTVTCVTTSSGFCLVTKTSLNSNTTNVTFTVSDVTHATLAYQSSLNHDPETDSNGTTIVISKP